VWESAAIGMAAGAGLAVLALVVTGLHFVIVLAYTPLGRLIARRGYAERSYAITYEDGRGVLRQLLAACTAQAWVIRSMAVTGHYAAGELPAELTDAARDLVSVALTVAGPGTTRAALVLGDIDGVVRIDAGEDDDD
jgi:putative Mg2+ transporter-C (MgtC) family protein